jgi:hypothetical protein
MYAIVHMLSHFNEVGQEGTGQARCVVGQNQSAQFSGHNSINILAYLLM